MRFKNQSEKFLCQRITALGRNKRESKKKIDWSTITWVQHSEKLMKKIIVYEENAKQWIDEKSIYLIRGKNEEKSMLMYTMMVSVVRIN